MKKKILTIEEKDLLKKVLPILRKWQKEYRGLYFLKPEYRDAKYAEVFQKNGLEFLDSISFLNYLEIEMNAE